MSCHRDRLNVYHPVRRNVSLALAELNRREEWQDNKARVEAIRLQFTWKARSLRWIRRAVIFLREAIALLCGALACLGIAAVLVIAAYLFVVGMFGL